MLLYKYILPIYLTFFNILFSSPAFSVMQITPEILLRNRAWFNEFDKAGSISSILFGLVLPSSNRPWNYWSISPYISLAHLKSHKVNTSSSANEINMISIGPDIKFFPFTRHIIVSPYIEVSIAPTYLSKTIFDNKT